MSEATSGRFLVMHEGSVMLLLSLRSLLNLTSLITKNWVRREDRWSISSTLNSERQDRCVSFQ